MNKTISLQSDNSAFNSIPLTKEENKPIAQKSNFFGIELEKENVGVNIANRVSIEENALQLKGSKFENITSFSPNTNNPPIFSKNIRAKPTLFIPIQEEPLKPYSDEPIFSSEILAKLGIESIPSEMTYEDVLLQKGSIFFLPLKLPKREMTHLLINSVRKLQTPKNPYLNIILLEADLFPKPMK